jgi:hypothetical protein
VPRGLLRVVQGGMTPPPPEQDGGSRARIHDPDGCPHKRNASCGVRNSGNQRFDGVRSDKLGPARVRISSRRIPTALEKTIAATPFPVVARAPTRRYRRFANMRNCHLLEKAQQPFEADPRAPRNQMTDISTHAPEFMGPAPRHSHSTTATRACQSGFLPGLRRRRCPPLG